jgi:Flp pilus assembly protein TadD
MKRPIRFGTAISTLAVAAVLAGCATGAQNRSSIFGSKVDHQNIGLATRAQAALAEGQLATAVQLAERAVQNTPNDAGFRMLLGNCYFAAGRFASAEAAYLDSLTLLPGQPEVIMKMALVQIAQGKKSEAAYVLNAARDMLDAANYGLALALAGQADDAVAILNQVARQPAADARVRQNLALAYALSGDWTMARTVAAQDVPPDQLDARIQQWMAMATPSRPSDQVAALTGVTPSADPGMPQQLALNRAPQPQQAEAYAYAVTPEVQPQVQPQPQAQPEPQPLFAEIPAAPPPPPALPEPAPVLAQAAPVEPPAPAVVEAVQTLIEPIAEAAPVQPAEAPVAIEAPVILASAPVVRDLPTKFEAADEAPAYVDISETVRRAAADSRKGNGRSKSVVQLGAYSSPQRVTVAWEQLKKKYPALRNYTPMRARFDGPKGTVWRLSIKGFDSQREAIERCSLLKGRGGSCFVRTVAGDAPVQFASR